MQAATTVPTTVARGMTRWALRMLPAGIVAHSRPRNAQSVSVAVVVTPRANPAGLDSAIAKCARSSRNNHPTPTRISGRTFSTVVATCTWPALRTLLRLMPVNTHTVAMASVAADAGYRTRAGTNGSRYPTKATASAALVAQLEIQ